jgi:ribosomal protein S18 acetylase RimI-like enzyme
MPAERLDAWMEKGVVDYVADRMRAGEPRDVAEDNAKRSRDASFPDGSLQESHRVFDVVADGETVGFLWIAPRIEGSDQWWVYDIEIDEQHRRRGYARAALELGHAEAKSLGAKSIGLNVFAFNDGARALYDSLGYEPTAIQMKLGLD